MATTAPPSPRSGRTTSLVREIALLVTLAAVIRIPVLLTDFWFDEIYSLARFAAEARSIADIFLADALKHDNNHHLNTLALYLLGPDRHWIVYRLPGALVGLVAVAAAVTIGRRASRVAGVLSGLAIATSAFMVVYSTEARGYPWVLALSTVAFLALDRYLATGSRTSLVAFWLSVPAGIAAHPAMLHFYLGALLWSGYRLRSSPRRLAALHVVPMLWMAAWLAFVVRGSLVGGGPPWTWNELADQAFTWTFGYPLHTVPAAIAGPAVVLLVAMDARRLWQQGSDEGLFNVGAILLPVVFIAALSPPFLFPRYFIVPLLFFLLVVARRLALLAVASRGRAWLGAGIVVCFLAGNVWHIVTWTRERRSSHVAALTLMARDTSTSPVAITSWSLDQWTEMPLAFYAPRLGLTGRLEYVRRDDLAGRDAGARPIRWVTEVTPPCSAAPATSRTLRGSSREYVLAAAFPVCGPSGMSWYLYQPSSP